MTTDEKFDVWMAKVDAAVEKKIGLSVYDLPDLCYRDMFDDGVTPSQAARMAIKNEEY